MLLMIIVGVVTVDAGFPINMVTGGVYADICLVGGKIGFILVGTLGDLTSHKILVIKRNRFGLKAKPDFPPSCFVIPACGASIVKFTVLTYILSSAATFDDNKAVIIHNQTKMLKIRFFILFFLVGD